MDWTRPKLSAKQCLPRSCKPVAKERAAEEEALKTRFRPRMHAWLARRGTEAAATWEEVGSTREGRLAHLPEWLAKGLFDEYIAGHQQDAGAH